MITELLGHMLCYSIIYTAATTGMSEELSVKFTAIVMLVMGVLHLWADMDIHEEVVD